jgi:hypothetical protein
LDLVAYLSSSKYGWLGCTLKVNGGQQILYPDGTRAPSPHATAQLNFLLLLERGQKHSFKLKVFSKAESVVTIH